MVGQASEPTSFTDSNLNSGHSVTQNLEDDNGNTQEQTTDREHIREIQEEDICSCSLAKDTTIRTIPSSLNNNGGGSSLIKGGMNGKHNLTSTTTSPYILSLSTSRQHSNHHVLS